ncbi:hypothetical protein SAMN05216525_1597 [Bradyrhizobium sp. Gha]|nr:hypothetical protein SAMN05216525_1597 [Bradyrhizobium sp. Gha]
MAPSLRRHSEADQEADSTPPSPGMHLCGHRQPSATAPPTKRQDLPHRDFHHPTARLVVQLARLCWRDLRSSSGASRRATICTRFRADCSLSKWWRLNRALELHAARHFVLRAYLRACPLRQVVRLLLWRRRTEQSEWMAGQECPKETGGCKRSESRGRIDVLAKPLRSGQPVGPVGSEVDYFCRCFCHLTSTRSRGPLEFSDRGRTGTTPSLPRPLDAIEAISDQPPVAP